MLVDFEDVHFPAMPLLTTAYTHTNIEGYVDRGHKLPDPYEWVVELWVNGLEIFEDELLVQHAFVKRQREACVDELAVEKCL